MAPVCVSLVSSSLRQKTQKTPPASSHSWNRQCSSCKPYLLALHSAQHMSAQPCLHVLMCLFDTMPLAYHCSSLTTGHTRCSNEQTSTMSWTLMVNMIPFWLKPAHTEQSTPPPSEQQSSVSPQQPVNLSPPSAGPTSPCRSTRSGRRVRWPQHLENFVP